jgi:hypothetical protein
MNLTQQLARISAILNSPVITNCQCGFKYIPMGVSNCPKCHSIIAYDFEEENELIYEEVSHEASEV